MAKRLSYNSKFLILGASGGLGRTFCDILGDQAVPATKLDFDLSQPQEFQKSLMRWNGGVINCAAYTNVEKAEEEKELAHLINAESVRILSEWSDQNNQPWIHFSTDYVFGHTHTKPINELANPSPLCVYGQTKWQGDQWALKSPNATIIRTSWLYSLTGKSFPEKIIQRFKSGQPLQVVGDQWAAPTWSRDLVDATIALSNIGYKGLIHVANTGITNWHEYASLVMAEYCRHKKQEVPEIKKITSQDLKLKAERPSFSALDVTKALSLGIQLRSWKQAISAYVQAYVERFDR